MVSAITQVLVPGRIATPRPACRAWRGWFVLPLKDKGVRDGGRRDTTEVTVGSMVEVRLLKMFRRGCRAQSSEHRAESAERRAHCAEALWPGYLCGYSATP
jgi:hypothetical protein